MIGPAKACHPRRAACSLSSSFFPPPRADAPRKAENLVVVILDGFRWQEMFDGADEVLMHPKHGGVRDLIGLKKNYWRDDPERRRDCLLPFFWNTVAK